MRNTKIVDSEQNIWPECEVQINVAIAKISEAVGTKEFAFISDLFSKVFLYELAYEADACCSSHALCVGLKLPWIRSIIQNLA